MRKELISILLTSILLIAIVFPRGLSHARYLEEDGVNRHREISKYEIPPIRMFPSIKGLRWEPTRVVNGKVYDGIVCFVAVGYRLSEAYLVFAPKNYTHLRKEAFLEESTRRFVLKPVDGAFDENVEEFIVNVTDIKGGREYEIEIVVRDRERNIATVNLTTPYIREFENLGKLLYEKGIIVSASYMSGYYGWEQNISLDDYPLLGKYKGVQNYYDDIQPFDEIVQWKHIDWATGHGVNVFWIDCGTWEDWKMKGAEGRILISFMEKGMYCGIQWGPWPGRYKRGTLAGAPDWAIDLSLEQNREEFLDRMRDLVDYGDTFFSHPNYVKTIGRPAFFFYDAVAFFREGSAFKEFRELFFKKYNMYPFIIADAILRMPSTPATSEWFFEHKEFPHSSIYDALTVWVGFYNPIEHQYGEEYDDYYPIMSDEWKKFAEEHGMVFSPSIIPGFKHFGAPGGPVVQRKPYLFMNRLKIALDHTSELRILRIDTFNDFVENTFVEPSQREGFAYLEAIKEELQIVVPSCVFGNSDNYAGD